MVKKFTESITRKKIVYEDKITEVREFIEDIKPEYRFLQSEYGKVPLPLVLDIGLTQADNYQSEISEFRRNKSTFDDHLANDGFEFVSFMSDRPFQVKPFEHFLTQQLPSNIFRGKGILWFQESRAKHIFQLSGPRYDLQDTKWESQPKNELVLIGRNLDKALIRQQLADCLVKLEVKHKFSLPDLPW